MWQVSIILLSNTPVILLGLRGNIPVIPLGLRGKHPWLIIHVVHEYTHLSSSQLPPATTAAAGGGVLPSRSSWLQEWPSIMLSTPPPAQHSAHSGSATSHNN